MAIWTHGAHNDITDVPGILVGHAQDRIALTGVTAVLALAGASVGVAVEGAAPGTRETDLCRPGNLIKAAHAVLLCGGSAFGLDAAGGAMRFLEERQVGFPTGDAFVPIVPAAVLYDLGLGDPHTRPDAAMGLAACEAATGGPVAQGCCGAGTGCAAGKLLGMARATKTGIGSASIVVGGGAEAFTVGAIVAVNPFGDIRDPLTGRILAGARTGAGSAAEFVDTTRMLLNGAPRTAFGAGQNTSIGVVAVGGNLTKEEANKVARMAHDGLARTISPIHTMYDGDTLFCLATGETPVDVTVAGTAAAIAVELAVLSAMRHAGPEGGLPGPIQP
ncbi:MAG TPA: P1 family peptidase [Symbiobacteriaceae bacterium]|jgi:L-aminopeptidase/D-esterase-like protein